MEIYKRRDFLKMTTLGVGAGAFQQTYSFAAANSPHPAGKRIGIIGLDTSHSVAFTKIFNDPVATNDLNGYKVVAAYPKGSDHIKTSLERLPGFTKEMEGIGIKIVSSIEELLTRVDVVMLETNDGRMHLEQAKPVFKSGKRLFIDKPLAASLEDVLGIIELATSYKAPIFSSSSLRYFDNVNNLDKMGKVNGADTFSPATMEESHSDLYWYGIHGVELLFTVMGRGCKSVSRIYTEGMDLVTGIWSDNRIGTFRGIRTGKKEYGGTVFGENGLLTINPGKDYGYRSLMTKVAQFFDTGIPPVPMEETLEIFTFMTAAEESSNNGGEFVSLDNVLKRFTAVKK